MKNIVKFFCFLTYEGCSKSKVLYFCLFLGNAEINYQGKNVQEVCTTTLKIWRLYVCFLSCFSLVKVELPEAGATKYEICVVMFFTCWRSASCWNSIKLVIWKFEMRCPLAFEYKLGWTEFLPSGHLRSGFQGEKTAKWRSRSDSWPWACKNVLPHTSQIWRHQLLATPLLLDWKMIRNIHILQIFTM